MSILTTFFNLIKPAKTDGVKVSDFNSNMDIIDTEMHRPPLTINGIAPDPTTRNTTVTEVPLAGNLSSEVAQIVDGLFVERMTGGSQPVSDGTATMNYIKGNMIHTGYSAEVFEFTVSNDDLTVSISKDTFVAYVEYTSGTYVFTYTSGAWDADLTSYGISVTGTPAANDTITVVYAPENRGTITTATPTGFTSLGYNLYNKNTGIARVVKYSDEYGYKVVGSYTILNFSETIDGTQTALSVDEDGLFQIPSDGFVFVTGGSSGTVIFPTWSDWIDEEPIIPYTPDEIDLTAIMVSFPYGLCKIGLVQDEIYFNTQTATQRIDRMAYSAENLASVIESGVDYEYDTNYIYSVLETPVATSISLSGTYDVWDHGIEFFDGTTVPLYVETLYGENLKDKLRMNVLTISAQTLSSSQKTQVQTNIGFNVETLTITPNTTYVKNFTAYGRKYGRIVVVSFYGDLVSGKWNGTYKTQELFTIKDSSNNAVNASGEIQATVTTNHGLAIVAHVSNGANTVSGKNYANTFNSDEGFHGTVVFINTIS